MVWYRHDSQNKLLSFNHMSNEYKSMYIYRMHIAKAESPGPLSMYLSVCLSLAQRRFNFATCIFMHWHWMWCLIVCYTY